MVSTCVRLTHSECHAQGLENAECTETKVSSEHREISRKKVLDELRPANFRENQDNDLRNYQQPVQNRPEHACRLVRNSGGTITDISNAI